MNNVLSRKRWKKILRRRKLKAHKRSSAGKAYDADRNHRRLAILRKQKELAAVR